MKFLPVFLLFGFIGLIFIIFLRKEMAKLLGIASGVKGITDHFTPSRPWIKEEKKKIDKAAWEVYEAEKQSGILSGRFAFPGRECAKKLARAYSLSPLQEDILAAYSTRTDILRVAKAMGITEAKFNAVC